MNQQNRNRFLELDKLINSDNYSESDEEGEEEPEKEEVPDNNKQSEDKDWHEKMSCYRLGRSLDIIESDHEMDYIMGYYDYDDPPTPDIFDLF